jgi:hypothetical protein
MSIRIITSNYIKALKKNVAPRTNTCAKPWEGSVLINVDASFNLENFTGGIDAVIRDGAGNFIASCNNPIDYAINANTF